MRLRLPLGMFGVVGLIFLAAGIGTFLHTRAFIASAVPTSGVVTENVLQILSSGRGAAFYPLIRFRTADGREITTITTVGANPPAHEVNEVVAILYDPREPHHAVIRSLLELWLVPLVFSGLGLIFCCICAGPAIWQVLSARRDVWLRENGRPITAEITHVGVDDSLSVDGQHPYRIWCKWLDPATNRVYLFKSRSIWLDPRSHLHGKNVEVRVDPRNPRRYVVVTDSIPQVV